MSDVKIGRRDAARRALLVLGAATLAPSALSACGGEEEGSGELNCTDTSGLTPAQLTTRQGQQYTDHSPHADKRCDNCRFFQAPQQQGQCGSCQVIAGPINPQGHCNLWAAKS